MKNLILPVILLFAVTLGYSQGKSEKHSKLPSIEVKTLEGETFNTADISNDGKPIILSFWALWCKHISQKSPIRNSLCELVYRVVGCW